MGKRIFHLDFIKQRAIAYTLIILQIVAFIVFFLSSPRPILPLKLSKPSYMNRVLLSLEFFFFCYIYCCNSFPMFSITYKATILSFTYCNVFTTFSVTTHNKGISPAIAAFFVVEIRHDAYYIWTNIRSIVLEGSGKSTRRVGKYIFKHKRYICARLLLT